MSECGNVEQLKEVELAQAVQKCLRATPLILWGSGGTVPCKLPTMQKLAEKLTKSGVGKFTSNNFEQELGSDRYAKLHKSGNGRIGIECFVRRRRSR